MKTFVAVGVAALVFPVSFILVAAPIVLIGKAAGVQVSSTMELVLIAGIMIAASGATRSVYRYVCGRQASQ